MGRVFKTEIMSNVTIQSGEMIALSVDHHYTLLYTQKDLDAFIEMHLLDVTDLAIQDRNVSDRYLAALRRVGSEHIVHRIMFGFSNEMKVMNFLTEDEIHNSQISLGFHEIPIQFNVADSEVNGSEAKILAFVGTSSSGDEVGYWCTAEYKARGWNEIK